MKFSCFLIILAGCWLAFVAPLAAAERPPEAFLFVVDTSFSMSSQKELLRAVVRDSIESGMDGQIKPGDKISLWTFNLEVNPRQFTPREWKPEQAAAIASAAVNLLTNQTFAKISRLDLALVEIAGALEERAPLTVLLFSDGFEFVRGTAFDSQINRVYREHAVEVRRGGKSFVTLLRARNGAFVSSRVTILGDPLRLPELPVVAPVAEITRPPVQPVVAPPATATTIKASPAPPSIPAPSDKQTNVVSKTAPSVQPDVKPAAPPTATVASVPTKEAAKEPAPDPKPTLKPEAVAAANKEAPAKLAPANVETLAAKPPPTPPVEITPVPTAPIAALLKPIPTEKPSVVISESKPAASEASASVPAAEPKISPPPVAAANPAPANVATPQSSSPPPVPPPVQTAPREQSPADATTPANAVSPAAAANASAALAETALLPPPAPPNRWGYILIGGAVLLAAGWLFYFFWTRNAADPKSSIITRSLDQKRKS